ncbi:MAG: sigma-70 family RNA polymerase sigma factor [Planctomycetes bacterium]|nr:sigma-70 family RNA polymerase sigma factor [Planctomycetota bacterium]
MSADRDDRDRLPEEPDGIQVVLNALRRLKKPPRIAPRYAADPDHIADVLLDRADQFDGTRFLYLLTALQLGRFDELAREICERKYLMLDTEGLAEEAIVAIYTGYVDGSRQVPFRSWARQIMHWVAKRACHDPDLAAFRSNGGSRAEQLVMSILAEKVNQLDLDTRRLVWLAWMEKLTLPQIARETAVPFERVEWILASVMESAQREVKDLLLGRIPFGEEGGPGEREDSAGLEGADEL